MFGLSFHEIKFFAELIELALKRRTGPIRDPGNHSALVQNL